MNASWSRIFAVVGATCVAVVVMSSTSWGARVVATITGAQVVNGSITTADVKNGTVAPIDLSASARRAFTNPTALQARDLLTGVDGAGSGIDADTVDGIDGAALVRTSTVAGGDVSGTYDSLQLGAGAWSPPASWQPARSRPRSSRATA